MKFLVNGEEHDLPEIDSIDLGEAIVLYNYSGLTIDQVEDVEGLNPGLLAALMHIAIQRANPDLKAKEIEEAVKGSNLLETLKSMDEEQGADPPSASESNGSSQPSEQASGAASENGSESHQDDDGQPPIGTPRSATTATSETPERSPA